MYKNIAYIIRTKTNLHAGSAESGFGIIDKEVQRDTITPLPVINASSLKGAIRDHFKEELADSNELPEQSDLVKPFTFRAVFGDEQKEETLSEDDKPTYAKLPKQGLVKFLDARLLFLPLRSNKRPFYHVTSHAMLREAEAFLKQMGVEVDFGLEGLPSQANVVIDAQEAVVEDVTCAPAQGDIAKLKALFGIEHLAIFDEEDFAEALTSLPVIARNQLDNGKSNNLWYEEVVPRESIFVTTLCYYDNFDESRKDSKGRSDRDKFVKTFARFEQKLLSDHIQIGANASIGYGICDFSVLGGSYE
jgi:CRISPR-associated protein Cmr4